MQLSYWIPNIVTINDKNLKIIMEKGTQQPLVTIFPTFL